MALLKTAADEYAWTALNQNKEWKVPPGAS
jgi:hypothetical protein